MTNLSDFLFSRTGTSINDSLLTSELKTQFPAIGEIRKVKPIEEGYEDANILITSDNGLFVAKMFSKERSEKNRQDYVKILQILKSKGIPVIDLISGKEGFMGNIIGVDFFITKFFNGNNFVTNTPTVDDMIKIASYLGKINNINIPVEESYDSWGNKNLLKEYHKYKGILDNPQIQLLNPIIQKYSQIDFNGFSKTFIHGDMQRKHVLKNSEDNYCILDFGCMAYDAAIIDLSTFLAWFCLQKDNWNQIESIYPKVISAYLKNHALTEKELSLIPLLTKASYAAYFLKTSALIHSGDKSTETMKWHKDSKIMLELSKPWSL